MKTICIVQKAYLRKIIEIIHCVSIKIIIFAAQKSVNTQEKADRYGNKT
jgi:hypothetical protein